MTDREKFMEILHSVAEMAKGLDAPLTKNEIQEYFKDITLSPEQLEMVYQYILKPQNDSSSNLETVDDITEDFNDSTADENESQRQQENSKYLSMYLDDISGLKRLSAIEEQGLYTRLLNGDVNAMQPITDHWLSRVVDMARMYEKYEVMMEDLIQEGNIGLITSLDDLLGLKKMIDVGEYLKESVQKALEDYVDEMSDESEWTNSMIAKATLIEEAKQAFAEEYVKVPTVKELAEYTKISEEEIEDILKLSLDDIKKDSQENTQTTNPNSLQTPWTDMKFEE